MSPNFDFYMIVQNLELIYFIMIKSLYMNYCTDDQVTSVQIYIHLNYNQPKMSTLSGYMVTVNAQHFLTLMLGHK